MEDMPCSGSLLEDISNYHESKSAGLPLGDTDIPWLSRSDLSANLPTTVSGLPVHPEIPNERVNRRPVLVGNNKTGRTGKRRCVQCRKRHRECLFGSEDEQCEFCRSHNILDPCVKILGPKVQRQQNECTAVTSKALDTPSRALTVYDSDLTERDAWVLQGSKLLASDPDHSFQPMFMFFQKLSLGYGPSISHPALRHAICAFTCSRLPKKEYIRELEYTQLACNALSRRLQNPTALNEGDLFTAVLLVKLVRWQGGEYLPQIDGAVALMEHLYAKAKEDVRAYMFAPFWTMMRDEIMVVLPRETCLRFIRATRRIFGNQSFQECASYRELLTHDDRSRDSWMKTLVGSWQRVAWLGECRALRSQEMKNDADDQYISSVSEVVSATLSTIDEKAIMAWYSAALESLDTTNHIKDIEKLRYRLHEVMFGIIYDRISRLSLVDLQDESPLLPGEQLEQTTATFSRCFAVAYLLTKARDRFERMGCGQCLSEHGDKERGGQLTVSCEAWSDLSCSMACTHSFREKHREIQQFLEYQLKEIKDLKTFIETEFSWARCPPELEF